MALALMGGILAAWWFEPPWPWVAVGGAAALGTATALTLRRPVSVMTGPAVLLLVVILGAARWWVAATPLRPSHIGRFATDRRALVRLAGLIATEPHSSQPARSDDAHGSDFGAFTTFALDAERIEHARVWHGASGRVLVVVHERLSHLHAGDEVEVVGLLTRASGPSNPGERRPPVSDIAAVLTTDHGAAIRQLPPRQTEPAFRPVALLRRHMATTIDRHLDERGTGVLKALLIGDRERIDGGLKRSFLVTGTAHFLAISGLHVGLVVGMVWWLAWACQVPERPTLLLVVAVAFLYAVLTGLHAPALRACVMISVVALGRLVRQDSDLLNSLAVAAVVILLADPAELFRSGFQLSFAATLGIFLFVEPVSQRLADAGLTLTAARRERRRIEAAARLRTTQGQPRRSSAKRAISMVLRRRVRMSLQRAGVVSLVAWAVTLPLSAYYFRNVAWLCPAATPAAALPLWASLATGLLMCAAEPVGLAGPLAPLVRCSVRCLDGVLSAFAAIPGADTFAGWAPPLGVVALAYVGFGVIALRRRLGISVKRTLLALALVAAAAAWRATRDTAPSVPELTVLDVGHGQSSILRTPEGRTVLFDAGSLMRAGGASRTIERALAALGVSRVDLVVLSHPDIDHYGALPELLRGFRIGAVAVSPQFTTSADPDARHLLARVRAAGVPVQVVQAGDAIAGLEPLRLNVLHPAADAARMGDNDASLVVEVVCGAARLLTTGDLQEAGIAALVAGGRVRECSVLVAPHHGRHEANLDALVQAVRPQVVVASGPLLSRVQKALPVYGGLGARVFVTGHCGAVTVTVEPEPRVRTWRRNAEDQPSGVGQTGRRGAGVGGCHASLFPDARCQMPDAIFFSDARRPFAADRSNLLSSPLPPS